MRKPAQTMPLGQSRSAHYLRRSRPAGFPRLSVALSVVCDAIPVGERQHEKATRVSAWSAAVWGAVPFASVSSCSGAGTDAQSFWDWLARVRHGIATVWVWQLGAGHGLVNLGFWDAVARGLWALDGYDPFTCAPANKGASQALRGMCILQDPPFMVLAKESHAKGIVKFVCARNLGIDQWESVYADLGYVNPGGPKAGAPAIWVRELAAMRAESLAQWLQQWYATVEELNLGGLRHTAAAQSWHGWRSNYMQGPILVHNNEQAISLERASIHPGRNECYTIGHTNGPIFQVDARGFYNAIAARGRLPARIAGCAPLTTAGAILLGKAGWLVIAEGRVRTNQPLVPVRRQGRTIYPTGEFVTTLCWPEWQLLIDNGQQVDITRGAWYAHGDVCKRYMLRLWQYRLDCERSGRKARAACVKRMANSLIGKFAAWDWCWRDEPALGIGLPFATWYNRQPGSDGEERWRAIGWHTQKEVCNGESQDSAPAISAWVYSQGRVQANVWLSACAPGKCHYIDTDGLFVDEQAYANLLGADLIRPDSLGGLSLVKVHDNVQFAGLKLYKASGRLIAAGISEGAHLVTDGGWEFWHPERVTQAALARRSPRATLLRYEIPDDRPYLHGEVLADGSVRPFHLPMKGDSDAIT